MFHKLTTANIKHKKYTFIDSPYVTGDTLAKDSRTLKTVSSYASSQN